MNRLDRILKSYADHISVPWNSGRSGAERVLFAVYDKHDELRLRARIADYEEATINAGHKWLLLDLTDSFPLWMSKQDYRDEYFTSPDLLEGASSGQVTEFVDHLIASLKSQISDSSSDKHVCALIGVGTLFGLARISRIVEGIAPVVKGRLLVFFPGEYQNNNYRLLGARDGWNYLAVPITGAN